MEGATSKRLSDAAFLWIRRAPHFGADKQLTTRSRLTPTRVEMTVKHRKTHRPSAVARQETRSCRQAKTTLLFL